MNRCLFFALVLVFTHRSPVLAGQAKGPSSNPDSSANAVYDAKSFALELHRLTAVLQKKPSTNEMVALRDSLPRRWNVSTPEGTYSVSSEPLRNHLTALSNAQAHEWIENLAAEVEASTKAPAASTTQASAELDHILARQEFKGVRPPNAWDLFRQRMAAWLESMLLKLFGSIGRHPIGGRIVFWLIMIGAVVFVALWLIRFLQSRDRMDTLASSTSVIAPRTWQEWIRLAREAANRGDYREAVHSAYWAGIVRLEDSGVFPRDRARTPREYLRLVNNPSPGELAPRPMHREPLTALTSRLERIWYANRGAGPEDFQDSLRQLEALGCPLE
jgi:hypothetical protein